MRKITLTIFSFVIWFLLVWPFDPVTGDLDLQGFIAGIIVAIFVGILFGDKIPRELPVSDVFKRIFWIFLLYGQKLSKPLSWAPHTQPGWRSGSGKRKKS